MRLLPCISDKRHWQRNLEQTRIVEIKGSWHDPNGKGFPNEVSTTKYRWYSFIPKGLYEQFRRVANLYFAFHAAITLTPVTPVNPVTTFLPLSFVIGVAMAKEGLEDIRRGRADKDVNNRFVRVLDTDGLFKKRRWKELSMGNIVKVECDEFFPADLLFLFSHNSSGSCYVETANLDGETNLKMKRCPNDTAGLLEEELKHFHASVKCEQPNPSIYSFQGNLKWKDKIVHLGPAQMLLRGSKLRNTRFVCGAVLFTGYDTKIMMNSTEPPSKRSTVEHQLDYIIIFQLLLLVCMSTISAVVFAFWLAEEKVKIKHWYLQLNNGKNSITKAAFNYNHPFVAGVLEFFTCLVLYGYFVPISLYVSLEIVKVIQALFINSDADLYYMEMDKPASARTSNLNEELGQVSTILSDKTGTLTRNEMEFFKCSIAGISYGTGTTEVEDVAALRAGKLSAWKPEERAGSSCGGKLEKGFALKDSRLDNLNWRNEAARDTIFRFLEILAVCNTVVVEGPADPDAINYLAESPDEASFVVASKNLGVFLVDHSEISIQLKVYEKDGSATVCNYQLLNTIEFSSARKRMSVIVRNPEGRLLLFCKGADDVIFERLNKESDNFKGITRQHMNEYGEAGLRTLAVAYRELEEDKYAQWQNSWTAAKQDMAESSLKKLDDLAEEIESDLMLVGATAIEDKLQLGVPQAIYRLAQAGIKIWVLTGDKMETAINIGYACSLLRPHMTKHIIRLEDNVSIGSQAANQGQDANELCTGFVRDQIQEGANALNRDQSGNVSSHAIILDGKSLEFVLQDEPLKQQFIRFALRCDSIICCRTSPIQKAKVTELVRNQGKQICLAIGDGANDVGMIQKANIGVGISGMEGQQAAMSADFSIAQFRFLEKLLLVHGAWCYKRITFMIKYFFYKNFVFGFSIFFFNAYTRFSGQSIYSDWFLSLYNVIFTATPVVVIAIMDQDLRAGSRLIFPQLYKKGQLNGGNLLTRRIISWMLNGVLQAVVCFFSVVYGYGYGKVPDRKVGRMVGLYTIGMTMYTCVLFVVNIQAALVIQYWTWFHHVLIWGELVVYFVFVLVFGAFPTKISGELRRLFISITATSSSFYRITLLTTVLALLPSFTFHCFLRAFRPSDRQIVQELEKKERFSESTTNGSKQDLELMSIHPEGSSRPSPIQGSRDSFEAQAQPLWSASSGRQKQKSSRKSREGMEISEVGCNGIVEPNGSGLVHRSAQ